MKLVTGKVFIWIIIALSGLAIFDTLLSNYYNYNDFSKTLSIVTSLIGLTGAMLYFKKNDIFRYFILFWIVIQFVEFSEYLINAEGVKYYKYIFKSKQLLEFKINQTYSIDNNGYMFGFNFLPIFYLVFYQTLRLSYYRKKNFELIKFRDNVSFELTDFSGHIIDQFALGKVSNSFLVKLKSPIENKENEPFEYCVISDLKSKRFGIGRKLNLNLYLVPSSKVTKELKIELIDLKYIDWVEGKITNPNN